MQSSVPLDVDPQDEGTKDILGVFSNYGQRVKNAYDIRTGETVSSLTYIQKEIERLSLQKSEPNAPKTIIQKDIDSKKAHLPDLNARLAQAERIKERIFDQTEAVIQKGIIDFAKSDEESKEDAPVDPIIIINSLNREIERLNADNAREKTESQQTILHLREQIQSMR